MEKLDPYTLPSVRAPQWDTDGYCYLYVGVTEHMLRLLAGCENDEEVLNVMAGQDPSLLQEEVVDVTMVEDGEQYPYSAVVKCKGGRLALIHFLEDHIGHEIEFGTMSKGLYEGWCEDCHAEVSVTLDSIPTPA